MRGRSRSAFWAGLFAFMGPVVLHGGAMAQIAVPHERPPVDPWVPAPRRVVNVAGGCQSHVVRDSYSSLQVNVDPWGCNIPGDAANEPSIAVSLTDPRKMVIGWRQFNSVLSDFREPGWAYSHDGGHTWVFRGSLDPGVFGSDPVLAPGPDGEIYYLSINFEQMRLFHSLDGGLTWPTRTQVVPSFYDKPWMTVDGTEGVGRGNIYITSPEHVFLRSADAGRNFTQYLDPHSGGFTIAVAPNGSLWTSNGSFLSGFPWEEIWVGASHNANDAASVPLFEATPITLGEYRSYGGATGSGLLGQPWVATDHSIGSTLGNIYALVLAGTDPRYPDATDLDPYDVVLVRSTDHGESWSTPLRVNDDPYSPTSLQWFNMMSVAPNGRIDVAWNDTRNSGVPNVSELYYSYSTDGGETFAPNIAVSIPFDSTIGFPSGSPKIGDYYHMVSDNLGVNVAYAATFNGEQDIYFLRIGPWDCNGNEIDDALDINELPSGDCNANEVPDECEYRVDVDGDGLTTLSDFAEFQRGLTGPRDPVASARGAKGSKPIARAPGSDQSTIENRQSPIPCVELLDPDHDNDADLHDLYLLQHVLVGR